MNAGHFFIGLAGPVLMGGPPLVSATWFPPHQRTTSTAISTAFAFIGIAASFLIGPLIVPDVQTKNSTAWVSILYFYFKTWVQKMILCHFKVCLKKTRSSCKQIWPAYATILLVSRCNLIMCTFVLITNSLFFLLTSLFIVIVYRIVPLNDSELFEGELFEIKKTMLNNNLSSTRGFT